MTNFTFRHIPSKARVQRANFLPTGHKWLMHATLNNHNIFYTTLKFTVVPYKSNDNVDDAENIENGATLMIEENLLKEQAGEDIEYETIDEADLLRMDYTETNIDETNLQNPTQHDNSMFDMTDLNNSILEDEPDTQQDHSTTNANPITTFNTTNANNSIFDMTDLNDSILEHEPDMQPDHPTTSIYTITTLNTMDADNEDSGIQTQNTTNNTQQNSLNITATNNNEQNGNNDGTADPDHANIQISINNIDEHTKTTDPLPDIQNIPSHLLQPFRILYSLKQKRDKQQATIDNLNEHHNTNTTPNGLKVKHKCKLHLPPQFRERWERTLENASNNLLEVILDYQQWSLQDTNMKIQHRTQHLLNNAKDKQLAKQIITKTNELGEKYTKRTITSMIKSTKRVKRLQPNKTTTLISKHITNNQTQSSNCHSMISPIVSGHNTPTMTKPRGPPLTPPRHNVTTTNHFTPHTLQRTTNNSNSHPTNTTTLFTRPPIHKASTSIPHSHRRPPHATITPITYHSPRHYCQFLTDGTVPIQSTPHLCHCHPTAIYLQYTPQPHTAPSDPLSHNTSNKESRIF